KGRPAAGREESNPEADCPSGGGVRERDHQIGKAWMKKKEPTKPSVGARIIRGLEELVEALEKKEPIAAKFNFRRIELDLRPTPYDPELVKKTRHLLDVSQA